MNKICFKPREKDLPIVLINKETFNIYKQKLEAVLI